MDAVELGRQLVRYDTVNPPGNEQPCAQRLGGWLEEAGLDVQLHSLGEARASVVARLEGSTDGPPLCWTGHIDTVPLGQAPWSVDPWAGELGDGKLYGRGSTDMKAAIGACVSAVHALTRGGRRPRNGLTLVLTAGEETGCEGARDLASRPQALGEAGAIVVGEPTGNELFSGHKGALWLRGRATGRTAHGSMPERGINAIYRAARAVLALERVNFDVEPHPLLGRPTLNVGTIQGGMNINSVPDEATIGIDVRSIPGQRHESLREQLSQAVGPELELTPVVDVESLYTDPSDAWVTRLSDIVSEVRTAPCEIGAASYFTDGAILHHSYRDAPAAILGPGEPAMAHQTDEHCRIDRIEEATELYRRIIQEWCEL